MTDLDGNVVGSTTTDANGAYSFTNLAPGDYIVVFEEPNGFSTTTSNQGADATDSDADETTGESSIVNLTSGEMDNTIDAGYIPQEASVDIEKYTNGEDADTAGVLILVPDAPVTVTWTYEVTNTGDQDLINVVVLDDQEGVVGVIPFLAAGASQTLTLTGTAMRGSYTNIATVTGQPVDDNGTPTGTPVTDEDPSNYTGVYINIDKEADRTEICPGEEVNFTLTMRILGGVPGIQLRGIGVTDSNLPVELMPDDQYFVDASDVNNNDFVDFGEEFVWEYTLSYLQTTTNHAEDMAEVWYVDPATGASFLIGEAMNMDNVTVTVNEDLCASLGDFVWEDLNANGQQDANEPGIEGVTVMLLDAAGNMLDQTTTAVDGSYGFNTLIPGDYRVKFTAPTGFTPTVANTGNDATDSDANITTGISPIVNLVAGEHDPTIDAGYYEPASIGDFVWEDKDADGQQDMGEPGIEGVTVMLLRPNGTMVTSTTTDQNGAYSFDNLVPGNYIVKFTAPTGFEPTPINVGDDTTDSDPNPGTGRSDVVTLISGDENNTIDAGYYAPASLGDYVWLDEDADGMQDAGEDGIGNVTVILLDENDTQIDQTTTNSVGFYEFTNLEPGTYTVVFTAPNGYEFSPADQNGDAFDSDANVNTGEAPAVTLESGDNDPTIDAGVYLPATLGDFVWEDEDGDGLQDPTENGVAGVTVNLIDENGIVVQTETTGANGEYLFTGIVPGTYTVQFTDLPTGFSFVPANQGNDALDSDANPNTGVTASYTLTSGSNITTVDAGVEYICPVITANITKVDATCGNATGSASATVVGGISPYTYLWSTGAAVATVNGLAAGIYTVTVTDANGCTSTGTVTINNIGGPSVTTGPNVEICAGSSVTIMASATNGTAPYSFVWSAGLGTNASVTITPATTTTYTVTVVDANSCFATDQITVTVNPNPTVAFTTVDATCGNANGSATAAGQGGTAPYNYIWGGGQTSSTISGLAAGTYNVTVIDAKGCVGTGNVTINNIGGPTANIAPVSPICVGESATLTASATGGTAPYTYAWSNTLGLGASKTVSPASTTTYTVTVTDANNCTATAQVTVVVNPNPTVAFTTVDATCDASNGSATASGQGGTAPYTFSWSNGLGSGATQSGLAPGTYEVTVVDANGCEGTGTVTIEGPACASLGDYVWADLNGNGQQDGNEPGVEGVVVNLLDANGAFIETTTTDGSGLYLFTGLEPGDYIVEFVLPTGNEFTGANQGVDATDSDANTGNGQTGIINLSSGEDERTVDAGLTTYDLSLTKSLVTAGPFSPGSTVAFDITVTNEGSQVASNVVVTDRIPAGLTITGFNALTSGAINNGNGTFTIPSLAINQSKTFRVITQIDATFQGTSLTNVAEITTDDGDDTDSTPDNEVPTEDDQDDEEIPVTQTANVDIEKYTNGQDADDAPGVFILVPPTGTVPVTWTYVVTNTGTLDLINAVVTDDQEGVIGIIPFLAAGESTTLTLTETAIRGMYHNVGTVTAMPVDDNGTPTGNPVTDSDPSNYTGIYINIDKEADKSEICPGEPVNFTLTMRILGGAPGIQLRGIGVHDTNLQGELVPYGMYFVTSSDLNGNGFVDFIDNNGDGVSDEEFVWEYTLTYDQTTTNHAEDMAEIWFVDPVSGLEFQVGEAMNMDDWTVTVNEALCGGLGDFVWNDLDGDGIQDANEPGVQGVTM
ncbi:MAG: SdrD B-like domain-containing protein [Saprospiraceae bacterium]